MSTAITTSTISLFRNETPGQNLVTRRFAMPFASARSSGPPAQIPPPRAAVTLRAVEPPPDDLPAARSAVTMSAVEPPAETTPLRPTVGIRAVAAPVDTFDAHAIAVLDAPLAFGETASAGFARKEHEVGTLFAQLGVPEALALHARLASPQHSDELANKFMRLTEDRRSRLLTFLANVRRRALVAGR